MSLGRLCFRRQAAAALGALLSSRFGVASPCPLAGCRGRLHGTSTVYLEIFLLFGTVDMMKRWLLAGSCKSLDTFHLPQEMTATMRYLDLTANPKSYNC